MPRRIYKEKEIYYSLLSVYKYLQMFIIESNYLKVG